MAEKSKAKGSRSPGVEVPELQGDQAPGVPSSLVREEQPERRPQRRKMVRSPETSGEVPASLPEVPRPLTSNEEGQGPSYSQGEEGSASRDSELAALRQAEAAMNRLISQTPHGAHYAYAMIKARRSLKIMSKLTSASSKRDLALMLLIIFSGIAMGLFGYFLGKVGVDNLFIAALGSFTFIDRELEGKKIKVEITDSKDELEDKSPRVVLKKIQVKASERFVVWKDRELLYWLSKDCVFTEGSSRFKKAKFVARFDVDYSEPLNKEGKISPRSNELEGLIVDSEKDDEAEAANIDSRTAFEIPKEAYSYIGIAMVIGFLSGLAMSVISGAF